MPSNVSLNQFRRKLEMEYISNEESSLAGLSQDPAVEYSGYFGLNNAPYKMSEIDGYVHPESVALGSPTSGTTEWDGAYGVVKAQSDQNTTTRAQSDINVFFYNNYITWSVTDTGQLVVSGANAASLVKYQYITNMQRIYKVQARWEYSNLYIDFEGGDDGNETVSTYLGYKNGSWKNGHNIANGSQHNDGYKTGSTSWIDITPKIIVDNSDNPRVEEKLKTNLSNFDDHLTASIQFSSNPGGSHSFEGVSGYFPQTSGSYVRLALKFFEGTSGPAAIEHTVKFTKFREGSNTNPKWQARGADR